MANDAAWDSGWQQGEDATKKRKDKKDKKDKSKQGTQTTAQPGSSGGNPWSILSYLPKLHSGGKVKKTGGYLLRKGERVITAAQAKKYGIGNRKKASKKRVACKG